MINIIIIITIIERQTYSLPGIDGGELKSEVSRRSVGRSTPSG